jgi:uncharacterized protein YlxW (UPF0749 family)
MEGGKMDFWHKVKKDLQKEIKAGIAFIRESTAVVKKKTEELTEEGKKQYKIFELKTKVQKEITELGGRIYDLSSRIKNPMLDTKVKAILARIKKLESQVAKLEVKPKVKKRKASTKLTGKTKSK